MDLRRLTGWPGGLQDRRPGMQGLREAAAFLIFQEYATNVKYCSVQVRSCCADARVHASPSGTATAPVLKQILPGLQMSWAADRPEWQQAFGGEPHTVSGLQIDGFSLVDTAAESAVQSLHPSLEIRSAAVIAS